MSDPSSSTHYLTAPQTSHLVSLHHLLSLSPSSLQSDHQRIALAIRAAVDAVIRDREDEVQEWRDRIRDGIRDIAGVERAVGVGRGEGRRFEIKDNEPLPEQYEQLTKHRETLLEQYSSRLSHLQTLHATLGRLSSLLGEGFTCPALLPIQATRASLQSLSGQQAVATEWIDVCESTVANFESLVEAAELERSKRMMQVVDAFTTLHWQYQELSLPPLLPHPHHVPAHLLPSRSTEETPGVHATYERAFWRFHERVPPEHDISAEEEQEMTEERERIMYQGLEQDGVEPTLGLIYWAEALNELWQDERATREARIQELYDAILPLWARLDIDQADQDDFTDGHRGCSLAVIRAYEAEWERLLEIRKSSLSAFVLGARREIEQLADQLMMGADERAEFPGFIDDEFSEELLHAHEQEVERLKDEIHSKETLLPRVREWMALRLDEEELERSMNDPNRFSKRGGAMLKEERMRKRVNMLKPKIEAELLAGLPTWEEAAGRPFMVQGQRVVDVITEALQAKEMAKEAKKAGRARPPPAAARATPAPSTSRKRAAPSTGPGPTPMGANQAKRIRMNPVNTGVSSVASSISRLPRSVSASAANPPPICALPRPTARVLSTSTLANTSKPVMNGWNTGLGKDGGRRPRRDSFKPRPSIVPVPTSRKEAGAAGWELHEEEEEDVF